MIRRACDAAFWLAIPLLVISSVLAVWSWSASDSLYAFERRYHLSLPNGFLWLPLLSAFVFVVALIGGRRRSRILAASGLAVCATIGMIDLWWQMDRARTLAMPYPNSASFAAVLVGVPFLTLIALILAGVVVLSYGLERSAVSASKEVGQDGTAPPA